MEEAAKGMLEAVLKTEKLVQDQSLSEIRKKSKRAPLSN